MNRTVLPVGVIPARANSSRFPLKILAQIHGKPMIQYVWESARKAISLGDVFVATDCPEIARVVEGFGGRAVLTRGEFESGTDRVASVIREIACPIVVNIQGDEPLLPPAAIDRLVEALEADPSYGMATLAVRLISPEKFSDPNIVKVLFSSKGEAIGFSREGKAAGTDGSFHKHIGIYAYRRDVLLRLCELTPVASEKAARLEQLRALENGIRIKVIEIDTDTIAVDTPSDISLVEKRLSQVSTLSR